MTRVLVVEPHPATAAALIALLGRHEADLAGWCHSLDEAEPLIAAGDADVVLVSWLWARWKEPLKRLRLGMPIHTRLVGLLADDSPDYFATALGGRCDVAVTYGGLDAELHRILQPHGHDKALRP